MMVQQFNSKKQNVNKKNYKIVENANITQKVKKQRKFFDNQKPLSASQILSPAMWCLKVCTMRSLIIYLNNFIYLLSHEVILKFFASSLHSSYT